MKKIKQIMMLIFMCCILSGCDVTYNLTIDGDKLSEDVIIRYNDSSLTYDYVNSQFPSLPVDYNNTIDSDDLTNVDLKFALYDKKISTNNNGYIINYKYDNFTRKTINKSNVAKHAFNFFQYMLLYDDNTNSSNNKVGTIEIVTNNVMNVYETNGILQNVTVNITTNRKVLEHNADSVNGSTYTWYYNRNNYKKNISLKMYYEEEKKTLTPPTQDEEKVENPSTGEKEEEKDSKKGKDKDKKSTSPIIFIIFFLSFIVVLFFVISLKK